MLALQLFVIFISFGSMSTLKIGVPKIKRLGEKLNIDTFRATLHIKEFPDKSKTIRLAKNMSRTNDILRSLGQIAFFSRLSKRFGTDPRRHTTGFGVTRFPEPPLKSKICDFSRLPQNNQVFM